MDKLDLWKEFATQRLTNLIDGYGVWVGVISS